MVPVTTRFAPSPTGPLHLGHVHAALTAATAARDSGGPYLVRLEDLDATRCTEAHAARLLEDLAWLGLAGDAPPRRQSEHLAEYAASLDQLAAADLLYPCFCSRAEVLREAATSSHAPHTPDGGPLYPGTCRALPQAERARRLEQGVPHVLRLRMAEAQRRAGPLAYEERGLNPGHTPCDPASFGDIVLARRDLPASYHLAVVHDDALQGVTLVTRGVDLAPATHLHCLLQALLGLPTPAYAHHRLLCDAAGRRLSKRDGAASVAALRAAGLTPSDVLAAARSTVGQI